MKRRLRKSLPLAIFLSILAFGVSVFGQTMSPTAPALVDEVTDSVRWHSWGERAFQEARRENKPVFLSIEARWQSDNAILRIAAYQNPRLSDRINRLTIPVRVDADQRPDLVRRYARQGLPTVLMLDPQGFPFLADDNQSWLGGRIRTADAVDELLTPFLPNRKGMERPVAGGTAWTPKPPAQERFSSRYIELILLDVSRTYDERFGGYGDPEQEFVPKQAPVPTLRFLLEASQLLGHPNTLVPFEKTLQSMVQSGQYYSQGFPEQSAARTWLRLTGENTLATNMGLLELYLQAFKYLGGNIYMETAYQLQDDTEVFQDIFLRKGFSGAFYSAQRALAPPDEVRGLDEGPMIQSLLTPAVAQAIRSYFLLTQSTHEPRWSRTAVRATDFLVTEMVRPDGRTLYSLDRDGPGVDSIFSAYPAMADALLETYQQTSDRAYLAMAETVMDAAHLRFWDETGYYRDIQFSSDSPGLLQSAALDLDGNARAAEVWMKLDALQGNQNGVLRDRARTVLETLSGEALGRGHEAAEFARVMLRAIRPPITAVVVGSRSHTTTLALRDACLRAGDLWIVVQVLDPEKDAGQLERFGLPAEPKPVVYFQADLIRTEPVDDPENVDKAVAQLQEKLQASFR